MGKGMVRVRSPHPTYAPAGFLAGLYGASVNIHSLTETALAMTIFRDEGRFTPSSSRAVATSHERRRYTDRRLQFGRQKSSQTMGTVFMPYAYSWN